jgi:PAS domain S-box-containing protein
MFDFFRSLVDTSGFPPRWRCGVWTPAQGWLHIISDLGVWSAYLAIPCVLGYFAYRKKDLPFRSVFLLFGAFILACGTTHLMEAIIFWWPAYRLAGVIKLFTALVSWATVLALIPVTPQALAMSSPEELEQEINDRKRAESELRRTKEGLEIRVQERTTELKNFNSVLLQEVRQRQEAETSLSFALRAAQAGMWEWDVGTGRMRWSDEFYALHEVEPGKLEPTFESWLQLVHEEDRDAVRQEANRVIHQRHYFRKAYRIIQASGEVRWMSGRGQRVAEGEASARVLGLAIDITDRVRIENTIRREVEQRKRAEAELLEAQLALEEKVRQRTAQLTSANKELIREAEERKAAEEAHHHSEAMFQVLFEFSPDTILVTNMDGRIEHCNLRSEDTFGYTREELLGQSLESLVGEKFHERIRHHSTEEYAAAYRSRPMNESFDILGKRKNGKQFPADILLAAIRTPSGSRLLANVRDVSHRKANEEIIRQRAKQQAALAEFSKHALQASDPAQILQDAVVTVARTLAMERSLISELTVDGQNLITCASVGWKLEGDDKPHREAVQGSVQGFTLAAEQPVFASDLRAESRFDTTALVHQQGLLSCVCVAIKARSGLFGVLGVFDSAVRKFTSEEVVFLQMFADALAAILDRSGAERRVQASLAEKELLLKEIHHRVKNNLQVISSLLDLQSQFTNDRVTTDMFRECQGRVHSMALVHERLYRSQDLGRIDFASYIESLTDHLFESYRTDRDKIRLRLNLSQEIHLPIDTAIPCGLLLNELVSNCLKHAFLGRERGELRIELVPAAEGKIRLTVADTGCGLPAGDDLQNSPSFGLQLVGMLTRQLGARLSISRHDGTTFTLIFPLMKTNSPGDRDT